jgi:proline iminopeptidase
VETPFSIPVDGGEIACVSRGQGPPALVLHGGPGLSDYTTGLTAELAGHLDTVRYQQRGLDPTTLRGPYTVESHMDDAIAVLDGLGIERAWAVGHSWGGHLALHLAVAHPSRLLGVVAIDPLGAFLDVLAEFERRLTSGVPPADAGRAVELDERAMAGEGSDEDALESFRLLWPGYFADPESAPPMPDMRSSLACYAETLASILEHFEQQTLVRGLPGCRLPALFVLGRQSPIPFEGNERTAALMPGASVSIVDRCGHFPWLEVPGAVRSAVASLG